VKGKEGEGEGEGDRGRIRGEEVGTKSWKEVGREKKGKRRGNMGGSRKR